MLSPKKLSANRRNAMKSTGPKTAAGKAISSQNGLTHGLTSRGGSVMPGEDSAEYETLRDAMIADLKPRGVMQREIVMDLINIRWKLRRVPRIEAAIAGRQMPRMIKSHEWRKADHEVPPDSQPALDAISILAAEFVGGDDAFARLELYRLRLERSMHSALRALRKLREETSGGDEMEALDRDTGLRPVAEAPEACRQHHAEDERGGHGPEARVTTEPTQLGRKTEPTDWPNSRPAREQSNLSRIELSQPRVPGGYTPAAQSSRDE